MNFHAIKENFLQVFNQSCQTPNLVLVRKCESTMDLARTLLSGDNLEFLVNRGSNKTAIFSLEQTKGRGRKSRVWESDNPGGMYLSLLDQEGIDIDLLSGLSLTIGLAVQSVLVRYGVDAKLKWPNDVVVGHSKICGILIESVVKQKYAQVIYGVGLNINQEFFPNLVNATSMKIELDSDLSYEKVSSDIVNSLLFFISEHRQRKFASIKDRWWEESIMRDKVFSNEELGVTGTAIGISEKGALIIKLLNGETREIFVGDVS